MRPVAIRTTDHPYVTDRNQAYNGPATSVHKMYDGAGLGKAIAAKPNDTEAALIAYEKDLFPRSATEAKEANRIIKLGFGDDAPQSMPSPEFVNRERVFGS